MQIRSIDPDDAATHRTFMTRLLKREDKVYRLCYNSTDLAPGAWYTNYSGPASVNFNYTATCQGLQTADLHRYKLAEYVVTNDIYVAYGSVVANGAYGVGGFTPLFLPSYQTDLTFTGTLFDLVH